ncbi:UDP-N-acetyl-D-mannosaminuronic acid dehydrogenase [Geosporobacter subterraneus DSM 17957]|uniref:UDP-N-acetyl-D-mannosaminuronic acid dehydrogenase n=1 Tax=Geosporobacter subterraneus DSM 17957 TaxID=1121919 RepID=A0A1M6PKQ0_9FIRM|nr:nucleotide sugar dehydrogenase [Geosporobacter subterraneus]SHK08514.1 UDP-N-acetyl-D-mannosaminuronic acid dehydrogenase [Geosporobacter subterraneus DSM 17957]
MNVYVFGLGHIGLPMAVWIALKGHTVTGIDINQNQIKSIREGNVAICEHHKGKHIACIAKDLLESNRLRIQDTFYRFDAYPAVFIITVGIADRPDGTQDVSPIQQVVETILPTLVDGDLLLFKTTMIPGTIDTAVIPKIQVMNKKIYVAYSPETISETAAFYELEYNERILSAMDEDSYNIAESFLKGLTDSPIHRASAIKVAETVKVVQNIARDVNIALINEISEFALELGIDIHELRKLVNTHPRVDLLESGPGVGGYCLPNALKYLQLALPDAKQKEMLLMNTARTQNDHRPIKIVHLAAKILKTYGKDIKNSKFAVIGLAMKDYCADYRYSPALEIVKHLLKEGAEIRAFDPLIPDFVVHQSNSYTEAIHLADCIIIAAKQENITFDPIEISQAMNKPAIVVDTRNALEPHPDILLYKV